MAQSRIVTVITKPGEEGRALAQALTDAGFEAVWWPAFDVQLIPENDARIALDTLESFDCVVFVSVSAVVSVARILGNRPWPAGVAAAAVGPATAAAIRAYLSLPKEAVVLAPDVTDEQASGSEALWPLLQTYAPKRVLIARAQTGREWLANQLRAHGADVTHVQVYRRVPHILNDEQYAALKRWQAQGVPVVVVLTSSEAADIWLQTDHSQTHEVMRGARAVVAYQRIAQRVQDLGLPAPACIPVRADALITYLQTLKSDTL